MNKFLSLLKAVLSEDMNLFKYKSKANSSKSKKIIFPLLLSIIFMYGMGSIYYTFGVELAKVNLSYIMLSMALLIPVSFTFIEGIYKSQSILFESKDNELLLSLPIERKLIIIVRLLKMFIFQFLYNLIFILPAFILYINFEKPGINFYLLSLIETLLLPIIPTIISCFLGFFIKKISINFKRKKLFQTLLTFIIFLGIFILSFNMESYLQNIVIKAHSINDMISKLYYPIGIYVKLINKFNIMELLKLLLISIVPLVLFIYIINIRYYNILSKEKNNNKKSNKKISYKKRNVLYSLIVREIKKYFSSPVYVLNTMFSMVLLVIATIGLCTNFNNVLNMITSNAISNQDIENLKLLSPKVFYSLLVVTTLLTSITSSSISIEGKTFNISKSLPVDEKTKLYSKILTSIILTLPFILISDLIFITFFKPSFIDILFIIFASIIFPLNSSLIGLLVNLKYPKMNASSDTEIVKQSMSSFISVMLGLTICFIVIGLLFVPNLLKISANLNWIIFIELIIMTILSIILLNRLNNIGIKEYKKIEI